MRLSSWSMEPDAKGHYRPGSLLRTAQITETQGEEHAEWKSFVLDTEGNLRIPAGQIGHRWQTKKGQWNIKQEDSRDGAPIDALLSLRDCADKTVSAYFDDFSEGIQGQGRLRHVPVREIQTADGPVLVATVYDLQFDQHGVNRGFEGQWPTGYDDDTHPFTPAWQEQYTGIKAETVIDFARQWAITAEKTGGKCSIIIGAGVDKGELFIRGMFIAEYEFGGSYFNHESRRVRKLLLRRGELRKLERKVKEKGLTIVPYRLYLNERGFAKLEIALAQGKHTYDKRDTIKERDNKRDMERLKKIKL